MFDGKTVTPFEAPEIDPHLVKRSHETFHVAHLEATDFIESRPRAVLGMVPARSSRPMQATPKRSALRTTS